MAIRHTAARRKTSGNDYFTGLIALLICICAAVSIGLVILNLVNMGFPLTTMPFLLIVIADIALVVLAFYLVLSGKAVYRVSARIGCFALAALLIFLNLFMSSNLSVTDDFLNKQYDESQGDASYSGAAPRSPGASVDITKPFSIYVSGADNSGDINQAGRSDVNMLIFVDPAHYKILLINTPRDYYVRLHGTTGYLDKLTHAGVYGIDMSEETLQDLYSFNIDYHVRVNFDTLPKLVDAMGGIVVDNPTAFNLWGNSFAEGEIYLDGGYALLYCRERDDLAAGDNDRGANQQRVIEAIISRVTKPNVVVHYKDIIQALSGSFRSNIPPAVITQLFGRQISLGGHWTIEKLAAIGTNSKQPTYTMGDKPLDVIIPDQNSVDEISAAIHNFLTQLTQ